MWLFGLGQGCQSAFSLIHFAPGKRPRNRPTERCVLRTAAGFEVTMTALPAVTALPVGPGQMALLALGSQRLRTAAVSLPG